MKQCMIVIPMRDHPDLLLPIGKIKEDIEKEGFGNAALMYLILQIRVVKLVG